MSHIFAVFVVNIFAVFIVKGGGGHNVFPMVTNPFWIPTRSIHNSNKYPTDLESVSILWKPFPFDLETYFQN